MSLLTIGGVIDFVRDFVPGCPQAKVVRKLNLILSEVHEEIAQVEWTTFSTRAPVTTGTVSVAAGSAAVTFSSAVLTFPNTDSLVMVRIDADTNATWFTVTPSSTTVATLSSKYAGSTDTVATYKIVYPVVVFPAGVGQVLHVQRAKGEKLSFATRENAQARASSDVVGRPLWYGPYVHDSAATPDDAHRLVMTPFPDAAYSYECSYMNRPTYLGVADATTVKLDLPQLFDKAVLFGTLALCWSQEDGDTKFGPWWGRFQKALGNARAVGTAQVTGARSGSYGRRRGGRNMDYFDRYTIGGS